MSADTMLQALLGSKHKVTMDLRSNLKQVKKETKEEVGLKTLHTLNIHPTPATGLDVTHVFSVLCSLQKPWETGVRTLRIRPTGRRCSSPPKCIAAVCFSLYMNSMCLTRVGRGR